MKKNKVLIVGSGNAGLCAGIAALERGAEVTIVEKSNERESGGNSRYTAGAMRFAYNSEDDLLPLLHNPNDKKLPLTHFGSYPKAKFQKDLLEFNGGRPLSLHQHLLIDKSYETLIWLSTHNIKFEPIYSRQAFNKDGKHVFWGGLTLEAKGEGVGLVDTQLKEFLRMGGNILYQTECRDILFSNNLVMGVRGIYDNTEIELLADAVVLACGGFEASPSMRKKILGEHWEKAKVRGTRHNIGQGIEMAQKVGASLNGLENGCHATPMDLHMPEYGNLDIPFIERKNYRKVCYFLGVMLNVHGKRFVDEGIHFRNYKYAQYGKAILNQPQHLAWQIFDHKIADLLYAEYRFWDASFVEANTLTELVEKMDPIDKKTALSTLIDYNESVDPSITFDPTILDGKSTKGLNPDKTNWANVLDTPPYKAYPVTCGITFTYAGLKVDKNASVLSEDDVRIKGLFACGEIVGGVFYEGYPGGSGLTSGAVFGRLAGYAASSCLN